MAIDGTLSLYIRDCRVELLVGFRDSEKAHKQPVVITVECEIEAPAPFDDVRENKLDRTLDYAKLYRFLQEELPGLGHIYLLESVADQIIAFCFRDGRVRKAHVRIEKTSIFPNAAGAGIDLTRERA